MNQGKVCATCLYCIQNYLNYLVCVNNNSEYCNTIVPIVGICDKWKNGGTK